MMLRDEAAVRGDDDGARWLNVDLEDAQELALVPLVANEKRCCRSARPIRLARPRMFGVIDVVEAVLLAQLRQRVGLKSKGEAEVEQPRVLPQRDDVAVLGD